MSVRLNPDADLVAAIREGLRKKGGYCPCRLERTEAYKCMCEEFRKQIADPEFEGYCHCMLYYKSNDAETGKDDKNAVYRRTDCKSKQYRSCFFPERTGRTVGEKWQRIPLEKA